MYCQLLNLFDIDKSIKFDDCNQIVNLYQGLVNFMCVYLAQTSSTGFVYITKLPPLLSCKCNNWTIITL